jgi:hypothetical protein
MIDIHLTRRSEHGEPDFLIHVQRRGGVLRLTATERQQLIVTGELEEADWRELEAALSEIRLSVVPRPPFPLTSSEYELSVVRDALELQVRWGPTLAVGWEALPRVVRVLTAAMHAAIEHAREADTAGPAA